MPFSSSVNEKAPELNLDDLRVQVQELNKFSGELQAAFERRRDSAGKSFLTFFVNSSVTSAIFTGTWFIGRGVVNKKPDLYSWLSD